MLSVIGQLLPLAVAVALSSVPLMAVLTILLGESRHGSALAFLCGYAVGMLVVTGALATGLTVVAPAPTAHAQPVVAIGSLVIGAGLLVYGVVLVTREPRDRPVRTTPRYISVVARVNVPAAFGIGFVLDLRPKALLLSTAAGLVLGPARLGPLAFAVTLVLFVVVGSSSVTIPVVFALVRPEAAVTSLQSARSWLQTKSRTVTVVALIVIGTVVIGSGLTKF